MGPALVPGALASRGTVGHTAAAVPQSGIVLTGNAGGERRGMMLVASGDGVCLLKSVTVMEPGCPGVAEPASGKWGMNPLLCLHVHLLFPLLNSFISNHKGFFFFHFDHLILSAVPPEIMCGAQLLSGIIPQQKIHKMHLDRCNKTDPSLPCFFLMCWAERWTEQAEAPPGLFGTVLHVWNKVFHVVLSGCSMARTSTSVRR